MMEAVASAPERHQAEPSVRSRAVDKPVLLMIGAVPPPFIGPTLAMQRLLQCPLLLSSFSIIFLDLSDRRPPENIGKFDFGNLFQGIGHSIRCLWILLWRRPRA